MRASTLDAREHLDPNVISSVRDAEIDHALGASPGVLANRIQAVVVGLQSNNFEVAVGAAVSDASAVSVLVGGGEKLGRDADPGHGRAAFRVDHDARDGGLGRELDDEVFAGGVGHAKAGRVPLGPASQRGGAERGPHGEVSFGVRADGRPQGLVLAIFQRHPGVFDGARRRRL